MSERLILLRELAIKQMKSIEKLSMFGFPRLT